jgi:hypothetical protein
MPLLETIGSSSSRGVGQFGTVLLNGLVEATAAPSGTYLKQSYPTASSGYYWIKPTGYSGSAVKTYVDMTNDGGGWVLIAKGRQSSDADAWFGSNLDYNVSNLGVSGQFLTPTVAKVNGTFVNHLMNGDSNGWSSGKYIVVNRRTDCTDGLSGVGDSATIDVDTPSTFTWVNQFGTSTVDSFGFSSATGTMSRYNSIWKSSGLYGTSSSFNDNYFGGPNDNNRWFQTTWVGHKTGGTQYHGWSAGDQSTTGFQAQTEKHGLQFVQVWAK